MFFTRLNRATLLAFAILLLTSAGISTFADNTVEVLSNLKPNLNIFLSDDDGGEHICGIHCNDTATDNSTSTDNEQVDLVVNPKLNQPDLSEKGSTASSNDPPKGETFFAHDQEYRIEGACWRECIHDQDSQSNPSYTYSYDEQRCSECGKVIETKYTGCWKNGEGECWRLYTVHRKQTCADCQKCKKCNEPAKKKAHYDYIHTTKRCKICGRSGYFSQPETKKEGPRTGACVWKYVKDRSEVGECCLLCPICKRPGDKNGHTHTTITKYGMCGHTKTVVDDNGGVGYFGHCKTNTDTKRFSYCGGNNDQNDPCECGFGGFLKAKGLKKKIPFCKVVKGGIPHVAYGIALKTCDTCTNSWFAFVTAPGWGECGFSPIPVPTRVTSCFMCDP